MARVPVLKSPDELTGDARDIAGGMSARGQALVLLPKGTVARLRQR